MSQSPERRRRLLLAKSLPAKHCPYCATLLERTVHPDLHVNRCRDRLKTVTA